MSGDPKPLEQEDPELGMLIAKHVQRQAKRPKGMRMCIETSRLTVRGAANQKIGRNDPCPCGSGLKYKRCCLNK